MPALFGLLLAIAATAALKGCVVVPLGRAHAYPGIAVFVPAPVPP